MRAAFLAGAVVLGFAATAAFGQSPTDIGQHASVVFPARPTHLVITPEKMKAAKATLGDRMPAAALAPDIAAAVSHGESWQYFDRAHGESYRVLVTPEIPAIKPGLALACAAPRATAEPLECRDARIGGVPAKMFRRVRDDGGAALSLVFIEDGRQYIIAYNRLDKGRLQRLGATPGEIADGERFLASFRFDGRSVSFNPPPFH